ncbi:hypothetical protein FD08_GL001700 [Lentilactobacillus parakefiri DSM 10551]|nr:hypothetical protein FD08_GL001700 [Lentilactobacillus parakefiri DSM 10551]
MWAYIFGEIIGYIGSALEVRTWEPSQIGIAAAITAFIAVNGIYVISKDSTTSSKSND